MNPAVYIRGRVESVEKPVRESQYVPKQNFYAAHEETLAGGFLIIKFSIGTAYVHPALFLVRFRSFRRGAGIPPFKKGGRNLFCAACLSVRIFDNFEPVCIKERIYFFRTQPVFFAASDTALATEKATVLSNALGIMFSGDS